MQLLPISFLKVSNYEYEKNTDAYNERVGLPCTRAHDISAIFTA
jgi:hypothetical protein